MGSSEPTAETDGPEVSDPGASAWRAATGRMARGARTTARATVRAGRAGARVAATGTRAGTGRFRAYAASDGADATGLARLTELHVVAAAGDAAVTVALAGTVFAMPTGQARGQVALFLLMTMAPFALLAPMVGPVLDRFRHGRRWAIGATLAVRAFLAWVLAGLVLTGSPWLFPTALGILVASRAYAVARASAVPQVLPDGMTLVQANSRMSVAGLIGMALGGVVAGLVSRVGPGWSLRVAFVVFVVGTVMAIRLPAGVDSEPQVPTEVVRELADVRRRGSLEVARWGWSHVPPAVRFALATNAGSRLLSGFLVLFLTFLVREHPVGAWSGPLVLALVIIAAGVGNAAGSVLGNVMHARRPEGTTTVLLLLTIAAVTLAAIVWNAASALILGLAAGLFAQLGKLCLDAIVQRDVAEDVQARMFSWVETILQLCWVVGGIVGMLLPLSPAIGFGVVAALLVGCLALASLAGRQRHAARVTAAPPTAQAPVTRDEGGSP